MKVKLRSLRTLLPSKKFGRRNKKKSPPAEHTAPASNDLLSQDEDSSDDTAPTEPPSPDRAKYEASSDNNSADLPPCEAEAEAEEVKGGTDDTSDANAREFLPKITEEKVGADDEDVLKDLKILEGKQEKTNRNAFHVNTIEGEAGIELKMDEGEKKNTGKEVDNDAAACRIKTLLQNAYGKQCFSGNELESKSQVLLERYAGREALLFAVLEHKSKDRKEALTDVDASEDVVQEPSVNIIVSNNSVDVDSDLSTVRIRNDSHATEFHNLISIVSNDLDNSPPATTELPTASATAPNEDNGNDIVAAELRTVPTEDDDNSIVELNRIGTKDYERLLTPTRPLARGGGGERSELTEISGASTSMVSEYSLAGSCTDVDEEDVYDDQSLNTEDEDNGYDARCDAGCYAMEEHPVVARLDKMVGKTTACDPSPDIDRIDDAAVDAAAGCSPMGCIDE